MGIRPDIEYTFEDLQEYMTEAENGDSDAMMTFVYILQLHDEMEKERPWLGEKRIEYLNRLVSDGSTTAEILLADAYLQGDVVQKDPEKAISLYEAAAEKGEPFGYECIGMMYYEGNSVMKDDETAFRYFRKLKGSKSFCSLYALAEVHRQGRFVTKNYRNACRYYHRIVNSKGPYAEYDDYYWRACFRLGQAYHYGMGVEKNLEIARELLKAAKELKDGRDESAIQTDITDEEINTELQDMDIKEMPVREPNERSREQNEDLL